MTSKGKFYRSLELPGNGFGIDVVDTQELLDEAGMELKVIMKKWKLGDSLVKVEDWYTKWFGEEDDEE